jgi:hypothetical protein
MGEKRTRRFSDWRKPYTIVHIIDRGAKALQRR